jgi:hypothetical protein
VYDGTGRVFNWISKGGSVYALQFAANTSDCLTYDYSTGYIDVESYSNDGTNWTLESASQGDRYYNNYCYRSFGTKAYLSSPGNTGYDWLLEPYGAAGWYQVLAVN